MSDQITLSETTRGITSLCLRFSVQIVISMIVFSTFPQSETFAQVSTRHDAEKTTAAFKSKLERWTVDTNALFTIQAHSISEWKNCIAPLKEITVVRFFAPTNTFVIKTKPSVLKLSLIHI